MSGSGSVRPGRKAQAEATRRRLLDAAIAAFTSRPYDAVAMGDIADAAGTAHGLPFHYFGNKRGLYLKALAEAAGQLAEVHQVAAGGTPRERIKAMLLAHFTFMREHAALAVALLRGGIGADPDAWRVFETVRLEAIEWMCNELGLDSNARALRIMLRAMAGAIDEATIQWLDRAPGDLDPLLEALLDMLASAIAGALRLDPNLDVAAALGGLSGDAC